jgi:hypothetical protein
MRSRYHRNAKVSRLALLLVVPAVAILSFPLGLIIEHNAIVALSSTWQLLRISALCYSVSLAAFLFIERDERWTQEPQEYRRLEVVIALVGLGIATAFLVQFANTRVWADLRYGLFSAIVSGAVLVPQRTDKIRALAFGLTSIATIQMPLLALHPPFVSLAIVCGAAAVICLFPLSRSRTALRRFFSAPVIVGMFLTAFGFYGLHTAYQMSSTSGLVIFSATVLFFSVGTIAIVVWGPSWERHSKS